MSDPNNLLGTLRECVQQWDTNGARYESQDLSDLAESLVEAIRSLDSHLSCGGTPPTAWTEGPDASSQDSPLTGVRVLTATERVWLTRLLAAHAAEQSLPPELAPLAEHLAEPVGPLGSQATAITPDGLVSLVGFPVYDPDADVLWQPWTNGFAVGFAVSDAQRRTHYVYLNPTQGGDEAVASAFIYAGRAGDVDADAAITHVDVLNFVQTDPEATL